MSVLHQALPAYGLEQAPYAYGQPQCSADFKTQPEDFIVEEVLGFEPCGEGEHLFLLLQTDDQNTRFTVKCLSKLFSVTQRLISYSGQKDRRGLTSQWFSIHLPGKNIEPDADALAAQGITLLHWSRHNRKLRIGTHKSNRFRIVLRNLSQADELETRLQHIADSGVPNYFGAQRFGHGGGNIQEALAWVEKGELPQDKTLRSRALTTLRSWWFNGTVGARVLAQSWTRWQPGDPIMLDGSQSFFQESEWTQTLQQRLLTGDIHIGAWLPAADHPGLPAPISAFLRLAAVKAEPRPMGLRPANLSWQRQNEQLALQFELPKGAFATTVLRELAQLNDLSHLQGGQEQNKG